MKVAVHQPNYLPYLGYFDKIRQADIFVILDDTQFSKGSFTNRNRIGLPNGEVRWLTVPIVKRGQKIPINEVLISDSELGIKHQRILKHSYHEAKWYTLVDSILHPILSEKWTHLSDLNISLIKVTLRILGIKTKVVISSSLNLNTTSTQKLVDICKSVKGTQYLAGQSGHKYMDKRMFEENGIELLHHSFNHPTYEQQHKVFVPNLSVIDYLMHRGLSRFWED